MTQDALTVSPPTAIQPAQVIDTVGIVAQIVTAATNPEVDADKAQKMMDMVLQLEDRNAKKLFYQAMARIQAKMPRVTKHGVIMNKEGTQVRSRFAKIEDIDTVLRPILIEEGIAISFDGGVYAGDRFVVTMTVSHAAGHVEQHKITMAAADIPGTSAPQRMVATMSFAKRAGIVQFFNIIQEGVDDDLPPTAPEPISAEQLKRLEDLLAIPGQNRVGFLKWLKLDDLKHLTTDRFEVAEQALLRKAEALKKS